MGFLFEFAGCANGLYEPGIVRPIWCWGTDRSFKQPTGSNATCSTADFPPLCIISIVSYCAVSELVSLHL